MGAQRGGDLAGGGVGVHVVGVAARVGRRRGNDRDVVGGDVVDDVDVHPLDLADVAHVLGVVDRPDGEHRAVLAREANRRLAVAVDALDDVRVHLAEEDHLRHLDRVGIGHPEALVELDLHAQALHVAGDVGPPPWTTTGFIPTYLRRTMSVANASISSSSAIAAPPYLMTTVRPWNSLM